MGTILLTGATGYLGSKLLRALTENGNQIIILTRNVSNMYRIQDLLPRITVFNINTHPIKELFETYSIETIIHCATDYGRKSVEPLDIIGANLIIPMQLLSHGCQYGVRQFINTDTILDKGISHYSLSKRQFNEWLHSYQDRLQCTNIALGHFYGPEDDTTKFVSFIAEKFKENVSHIDLTLGEQSRTFLYIDDVVDAFLAILAAEQQKNSGYSEYRVSANEQTSIRELVLLMQNIWGNTKTKLNFGAVPYRKNETMEYVADTSAIQNLGWRQKYPLMRGLLEMFLAETR